MTRKDLIGTEFDWFASDKDGHVAVFSTAGYGEIPAGTLSRYFDDDFAVHFTAELLDSLIPRGDHVSLNTGPGKCVDWIELANRGIFVYDWLHWSGPYEAIVRPTVPLQLSALPERFGIVFEALRFPDACFDETNSFDVSKAFTCE